MVTIVYRATEPLLKFSSTSLHQIAVSKWHRMIGLVVAFTILVLHNCEGSGKDEIPGIRMHDNYLISESELYNSDDSEYKEEKVKLFSDITESRLSRVRRFDPNNRRLSILDRAKSRTP